MNLSRGASFSATAHGRGAEQTHETITQLGQERGEVQAPTREQLSDISHGVDITDHRKPSVFIQACKDICRIGYDHSSELGHPGLLSSLIRALGYEAGKGEGKSP